MTEKPIKHLIADTTAFIKLSQLHDWSDSISTVSGVLDEIRNKDSRLAVTSLLPYKLHIAQPQDKSIRHVVDFAKKTGDFPALSRTDIELIAATYESECTNGMSKGSNLNSVPKRILESEPVSSKKIMIDLPLHQIGFFNGDSSTKMEIPIEDEMTALEHSTDEIEYSRRDEMEHSRTNEIEHSRTNEIEHSRTNEIEHSRTDESSDEDEGWITPNNLAEVTTRLGGTIQEQPQDTQVACLTSDYAMQNVLLQMGLRVLSIDGLLITQVRRYALQCRVCFQTTFDMDTTKCKGCGYELLIRVQAITVDGLITFQPLSVKQFCKRGLRFSTPKPIGGRHGNVSTNPRNKPRYTRKVEKVNPMDADYVAREAPFKYKDVHSKGANIGFRLGSQRSRKNPNEVARKGTRKKSSRRV